MRSRAARFALQSLYRRARTVRRNLSPALPFAIRTGRAPASLFGSLTLRWRRQFNSGSPGLGKADGNRLFRRPRTMFSFTNMVYLLPHKFTGLSAGRFSLPRIPSRALNGFSFGHGGLLLSRAGSRLSFPGRRRFGAAVTIGWRGLGCTNSVSGQLRSFGSRSGGFGLSGCAQLFFRFQPMSEVLARRLAAFNENFVSAARDLFVGGGV